MRHAKCRHWKAPLLLGLYRKRCQTLYLGAWFQTLQLLGFTEGFMVLKLVFNFVLGEKKLQPAFVAVINVPLLQGEQRVSVLMVPSEFSFLRRR